MEHVDEWKNDERAEEAACLRCRTAPEKALLTGTFVGRRTVEQNLHAQYAYYTPQSDCHRD